MKIDELKIGHSYTAKSNYAYYNLEDFVRVRILEGQSYLFLKKGEDDLYQFLYDNKIYKLTGNSVEKLLEMTNVY